MRIPQNIGEFYKIIKPGTMPLPRDAKSRKGYVSEKDVQQVDSRSNLWFPLLGTVTSSLSVLNKKKYIYIYIYIFLPSTPIQAAHDPCLVAKFRHFGLKAAMMIFLSAFPQTNLNRVPSKTSTHARAIPTHPPTHTHHKCELIV